MIMSGQWEVVGKGKIKQNGQPVKKLSRSERKKFVEKAPKVEDILPLSQVKTLYTALDVKETKKAPGKENAPKENESKKTQKKQLEKKKEPVKEKPPVPKSLENAVKLINPEEIAQELKIGQTRFQDAPLVWLKGLATYLNTKLAVEHTNPTFSGKPLEYPLCLLPNDVKETLKRALRDAGESVSQPFYEWCLTSMAHNMTKSSGSALGFKMILQLLAFQHPEIVVANIPKFADVRNSYQNRQPIGLSILWAVGLGGLKDLSVGITVWQEVMVPVIELRNYSSFVIGYLKDILSQKSSKPLSLEQFFNVLDVIYSPNLNLPSNVQRNELAGICTLLKERILEVEPDKGFHNFFPSFLERLDSSAPEVLRKELLACLVTCLNKDPLSYSIWRQLYTKHLPQSALLLGHLDTLWKTGIQPTYAKQLKETLVTFQVTNEELSKNKQKEEGLENCRRYCTELAKRMSVSRSFPWGLGSFLLMIAIGATLMHDIRKHGSFKDSCTGRFLNDVGALQYGEHAWTKTKFYSYKSYRYLETNAPQYCIAVHNYMKPYVDLSFEIVLVSLNHLCFWVANIHSYINEKLPIIGEMMNHYTPRITAACYQYSNDVWNLVLDYSSIFFQTSKYYSEGGLNWMKTNVFVGNLSPENLQKYTLSAINTTQVYAEWTYDWIWQKVQTLSKIQ